MKIIDFSYMSPDDINDTKRQARSRVYEYPYALECIKEIQGWSGDDDLDIHNTGCGGGDIHLEFAMELQNYGHIINSDNGAWDVSNKPMGYRHYDIMTVPDFQSDIVLCISTLEHLDNQVQAIKNLLEGVREGGYLIVTLDSPPVDLIAIEDFLGMKCQDVEERLHPQNSVCKHDSREGINIVKLVIQK